MNKFNIGDTKTVVSNGKECTLVYTNKGWQPVNDKPVNDLYRKLPGKEAEEYTPKTKYSKFYLLNSLMYNDYEAPEAITAQVDEADFNAALLRGNVISRSEYDRRWSILIEKADEALNKPAEYKEYDDSAVPKTTEVLKNWSWMTVQNPDEYSGKYFKLVKTPLTNLQDLDAYKCFSSKLNWLYKHYNEANYKKLHNILKAYNEWRKSNYIVAKTISKADYKASLDIEATIHHYGSFDQKLKDRLDRMTEQQREYALDIAYTCYGLEPEIIPMKTKDQYELPERHLKDYYLEGNNAMPVYYTADEMAKVSNGKVNLNAVVGKFTFESKELQLAAENNVLATMRWMKQYDNTEYDLRAHREVEGDDLHNKMVPITDLQGMFDESNITPRDFQVEIYKGDEIVALEELIKTPNRSSFRIAQIFSEFEGLGKASPSQILNQLGYIDYRYPELATTEELPSRFRELYNDMLDMDPETTTVSELTAAAKELESICASLFNYYK